MVKIMAILNLTPDSFFEASRVRAEDVQSAMLRMKEEGADIIDLGAVSTRPGADDVTLEEEWRRLLPALQSEAPLPISIDTTRAEIVRRAYGLIGPFIVNDISAGEDDPLMLETVAELGLSYVAMHKRGNPRTMDAQADYPGGIIAELRRYFTDFESKASKLGIKDWWLDPGLGFAKTESQNWEILENLTELAALGHPVLIGAADKRFTHGDNEKAHRLAVQGGAAVLRVHNIPAAAATILATKRLN